MARPLELSFTGPYSWLPSELPSVLDAECAGRAGIYLWTVNTDSSGELIYYVGETGRNFRSRFVEHFKEQLAGWYRLYDPTLMRAGKKRLLWRGMYGRDKEESPTLFVAQLPSLAPALQSYVRLIRFHLAPVDVEARLRKRIEAALAAHLRDQPGPVGSFQDIDIRYHPRRANELPVHVVVRTSVALEGLPEALAA
jgi:hypothetical protein